MDAREHDSQDQLRRLRHDLLNEIHVISGHVHLMQSADDCPAHRESLIEIAEAVKRLQEVLTASPE